MKYSLFAAAALLMAETAAFACSCINTDDPAELQRFATDAARDAVALVEVEALTSYQATPSGEQMKVIRTLAGTAPARFTVERQGIASSASCDILYSAGQRDLVILYPASSAGEGGPTYQTSGLCMDHLLDKPVFLNRVRESIGPPSGAGERG